MLSEAAMSKAIEVAKQNSFSPLTGIMLSEDTAIDDSNSISVWRFQSPYGDNALRRYNKVKEQYEKDICFSPLTGIMLSEGCGVISL